MPFQHCVRIHRLLTITSLAVLTFMSCNKNDAPGMLPEPTDSLQVINRWILDSMLRYYLYSDASNEYPSLSEKPQVFFSKLLDASDKFSWISNGSTVGPAKSTFDIYGFHFVIIQLPAYSANNLLGIVTLAVHDGPAERAGLSRGVYFSKVNGQAITSSNIEQIKAALRAGGTLKLTKVTEQNGTWAEDGTAAMTPAYFEERPVYTTRIFKKNGTAVGYIFYNSFTEFFDKDILEALDKIKAANASALILDLRYNPGGSVATAAKIAAALAKGITASSTFAIYKGNSRIGNETQSFNAAIDASGNSYRKSFAALSANSLNLDKLYILTSGATASAAEMLINNLRPYMQVIHIGETTLGKNKAGITIRDLRQPKQVYWYLQPMVFEISNADREGNYQNGLQPTYALPEYASLPLVGTGDPEDALINKALTLILGSDGVSTDILRKGARHYVLQREHIRYNSATEHNEQASAVKIIR